MNWHTLDIREIFDLLGTGPDGISQLTAEARLAEHGPNVLQEKRKKPWWALLFNQFRDFMIIVLIAAAIISGVIGDVTDTIIILVIVVLNAVIGFVQEYRAERAMEALKKMAAPLATVLRDGKVRSIASAELVPGDVVVLEAGSVVPADLRVIESRSLRVEEASLTGESHPVDKIIRHLSEKEIPLGDRTNMAYKNTFVTYGRGKGVVVSTGMNTEIGQIASMLQEEESMTPLQKRLADFGKKLSIIVFIICGILYIAGLLRGEEPIKMLLVAISVAVAAIPEALPAVITIALALGAKRMVKRNSLIRKLPAVETLGSVTYICTDKTGTLTQNKMQVVQKKETADAYTLNGKGMSDLFVCMALNNDATKDHSAAWRGDPTEVALIEHVQTSHTLGQIETLRSGFPRMAELPFDSERKCMTTIHRFDSRSLVITKGAAEAIAGKLKDEAMAAQVIHDTEKLAAQGMRVLAFGYKILDKLPAEISAEKIETQLTFCGLAGMIDPPREEVKAAIEECKSAGIHPVMITGDHPLTAASIAKEIGILGENELVLTGAELSKIEAAKFEDIVEKVSVYARVSPEQKLTIVKALQQKNHFVAMTGDGVNDAPSLKKANIGIAMGITGTEVSKEASHMILLDDNFATIVKAVREGRRIFDNIRKFIKYTMTSNSGEIWTIFLAPLVGLPIPLLPIHILWINLVTDGLPGLALTREPAEDNIMRRPPRHPDESIFAQGLGWHILWVGLLMGAVCLGIQAWAHHSGNPAAQTMVFTVLCLSQMGHVFAIRSDYKMLYRHGFFSNLSLAGAVGITFLLQLGIIYLPFANAIFKTQPLSAFELFICLSASAIVFHAVELEKWMKSRFGEKSNG